ncbi:hypothetical protein LINPERHAP2_LOCUS27777 [Linum perenne]
MTNFLWGQVSDQRKIKWKSHRALCDGQDHGGLGFRELESFNQALLVNQLIIES